MKPTGSRWMLVAGFMFGCMGVFVKLGAPYFSHIEMVFYRSFFGLLIISVIMRTQRVSMVTHHWRAHLWRGISGTLALALFFYCITMLPLATAVTLNYTSMTIAIGTGFCGVVLLLHPSIQRDQLLTGLLGLISGFLAGVAYINVKQLGILGEPAARTVFYFTLIATVSTGVWMLFNTVHPVTLRGFGILLGMGSTATVAQLAMTHAYRTGNTLVVGSLAYSTIVFASVFGMLLWKEVLPLDSWLGMALIIAGGVLSLWLTPQHPSPKQ
jgi:drug/metabolite transporter (DMT)-like permease